MTSSYTLFRSLPVGAFALLSVFSAAQSFRVETIPGHPWKEGSQAIALGNNGYVIAEEGLYHNGSLKAIPAVNGHEFMGSSVNSSGQVAGYYKTGIYNQYGFDFISARYDGQFSSSQDFGGDANSPDFLSDDGTMLGRRFYGANGTSHARAFVYRNGIDTTLTMLGDSPYASSRASDINKSGVIVGGQGQGSEAHAVRWVNNVVQDLGTGGAQFHYSEAAAISDEGDILVNSFADANHTDVHQTFIWSNGSLKALPTFGGVRSYATRMNHNGTLLGGMVDANGVTHQFLWNKNSGYVSLDHVLDATNYYNFSGWALNDEGQLLGNVWERQPEGYSITWSVLVTPQPVPEPLSMIALGMGGFIAVRRRRKG